MNGQIERCEEMANDRSSYERIIELIFKEHYRPNVTSFAFEREEIATAAAKLKVKAPKNVGDVLYSFRYRRLLPDSIRTKAREGYEWIILGTRKGEYKFFLARKFNAFPNPDLAETKIPDATPEIISRYALSDEQALLAKIRYNRLIDVFTGLTCYSMQNHLRTKILENVQIETDELYVGLDKRGAHYVMPVQAKGAGEHIGSVQIRQDFDLCADKFPNATCRSIGAQFMEEGVIALFEFEQGGADIKIVAEKHYRLVSNEDLSKEELAQYLKRPD